MLRWHLWRSRSNNAAARAAAAVRLGRDPGSEAARRLIELLKEPSAMVRETAARALRGICDPSALEPLSDALRSGVTEAAETLGRMRNPKAIPVLVEVLPRDSGSVLDVLGTHYPGWRQSQEARLAIPALIAFWETGEKRQRLKAAQWLGTFKDARAIPPLLGALASGELDYDLHPAALRALDSIDAEWVRREDALATIPRLAFHACWSACRESRVALEKIGKLAPQALVEALCHDEWAVRQGAHAALKEAPRPDAMAPLLAMVRKPVAAVFAEEALLNVLESAAAEIRTEDLQELVKLGDLRGVRWELKYACNLEGPVGASGSKVKLNCGHLRQLARQELLRRGIEA